MANTFISKTKANVGTSPATIYTVPSSTTSVIIGFNISNTTANDVTADVFINKSNVSADDVYIVKGIEIPTGTLYDFNAGNKIILETGDLIQVTSSASSSVDVIVSILEQT
jgi:hypothetical protein